MIYICIPTHNEQQTVGVVLWKLRQVLTEFPRDYQLLVADDASTDKTLDVLEPYTRVLPLTVIRSEKRQGWAASMEMLLREAVRRSEYPKRDVVVTLQADFSEEPDDLVALIKRMEAGADIAAGIKVSTAKEARLRRLARSLSRFFTRRQSWPEGVTTPFDGYRAYRLYAVKRAMEDRDGGRLIRYDGWAGQAELLRAVLPHARRVDALEVEDRTDRLQRPRREKPLAAAWQVRAMASGVAPAGLLGVDELDRTAATASRSRDRAQAAPGNGRAARSNGGGRRRPNEPRGRSERGERRDAGERGRSRGAGDQKREVGQARGERADSARRRTPQGQSGAASGDGRRRKRPAPAEGAPPEVSADAAQPPVTAEGETTAPKKRRRRRRRTGAGAAEGQQNNGGTDAVQEEVGTGDDQAEAANSEAGDGEGAPRKRRRRGGRRGGRTRRRPDTTEAAADGSEAAGVAGGAEAGVGAEAPARSAPEPPRATDSGTDGGAGEN